MTIRRRITDLLLALAEGERHRRALAALRRRLARAHEEIGDLLAADQDQRAQLATVIDEEFGLQPVEPTMGALIWSLERLCHERRMLEADRARAIHRESRVAG